MRRPFERLPSASATIQVDPSASVAPIQDALSRLFDDQQVSVTAADRQAGTHTAEITVIRDGEIVATSSAAVLMESLLLINSDVYITGSRGLDDAALPSTVQALYDLPFRLAGFPDSDSEKLLLIAVSRAIERRASEAGAGTLRVGFQRLSRLVDEPGTRRVYERLAATDLAVHAYGVGDTTLPASLPITAHTGRTDFHRRGWFVVFQPPADSDIEPVALYAIAVGDNRWDGFWTYSPERIDTIVDTVADLVMTPSEPQ
mgnify:CR=1 FL=1